MLPAKDWHVGKLKLSEERSSLRIRGCAMHTNGINTFMGKSLQPSPLLLFIYSWSRNICTNPFLNVRIRKTKIALASDP